MVPVLGDASTLDLITKEMSSAAATELLRAGVVVWPTGKKDVGKVVVVAVVASLVGSIVEAVAGGEVGTAFAVVVL